MDISIIIVNYNTISLTKDCINSIFQKTFDVDFEIILVDNGSTDGSKELFEKDERIKYIYSEDNLGFGRANNIGYKYCSGKYVMFLNSDTLLLNNALAEFVSFMNTANMNVGCAGCLLYDKDLKPMHSFGKFQSSKYFLHRILRFYWSRLCKPMNRPHTSDKYPKYVDYITGADLLVRREVIEKCGLFDPDFFMYYEEAEMQYRYRKRGYFGVVIDTPRIMHLAGASSHASCRSIRKEIIELRNRYVYLRKTHKGLKMKIICVLHLLMIPRIWTKMVPYDEKVEMTKMIIDNC